MCCWCFCDGRGCECFCFSLCLSLTFVIRRVLALARIGRRLYERTRRHDGKVVRTLGFGRIGDNCLQQVRTHTKKPTRSSQLFEMHTAQVRKNLEKTTQNKKGRSPRRCRITKNSQKCCHLNTKSRHNRLRTHHKDCKRIESDYDPFGSFQKFSAMSAFRNNPIRLSLSLPHVAR